MKNAKILETYDEIKEAMYKGQDIAFEMVILAENQEKPQEQFNYGESAAIKPRTGDYVYTDGTFSEERDSSKELKGVALWVTDRRMITLWPDVPDEEMTYANAQKWCKDNGRKSLDNEAMLAVYINREKLKDKINLKDGCRYWIDYENVDEDGDKWHRYLYISPAFQNCTNLGTGGSDAPFACQ